MSSEPRSKRKLLRRRYHPPLTPCQRLLASPYVDEVSKHLLRQRFPTLDPVALLKAIRDTQLELAAVGDGHSQPPARSTDDLSAFPDGLWPLHGRTLTARPRGGER